MVDPAGVRAPLALGMEHVCIALSDGMDDASCLDQLHHSGISRKVGFPR